MIKDAISPIESNEVLRELIGDIATDRNGTINRKQLGRWIKRHSNRVVKGLRIVKDAVNSNSAKWKVESVSSV